MKRINAIIKYIKPNSIVIDVGSDHALLSTSLTKCTSMKHIYNIEKNLGPLNRTIQNTKTIKNITNIHANGLDFKINEMKIDYCVIAGMGGNNIINILQHVNSKKCQTFILQPSNNTSDLRRFLAINGYFIVCDNGCAHADLSPQPCH
jgi:tRNA (adenine22-N1)-methyltransferase